MRAVIAKSFERIHRSNLVGMGVLPLQFEAGEDRATLGLTGEETYEIDGHRRGARAGQAADGARDRRRRRARRRSPCVCRIDTPVEVDYYHHGGILPFVLRQLVRDSPRRYSTHPTASHQKRAQNAPGAEPHARHAAATRRQLGLCRQTERHGVRRSRRFEVARP